MDLDLLKLKDTVRLLTGERSERFRYERAINLFQFQVWTLLPEQKFVDMAGLTAAVKLLEHILDYRFIEQDSTEQWASSPWLSPLVNLNDQPALTLDQISALQNDMSFRAVYDTYVAKLGGFPALLYALPPPKLDAEVQKRIESCPKVTDILSYRFRYARLIGAHGEASTRNHAKFFIWWKTRHLTGGRGKQIPGKPPSTKTMDHWWKVWIRTAVFLFLSDKCEFSQFPAASDDSLFAEKLIKSANDTDALRRFFGAYAFVDEAIWPNRQTALKDIVPESIPRIPIEVQPFTPDELDTIAEYKANSFMLGNYQPGDDD